MKAMSEYTRMGPPGRINQLIAFNRRLRGNDESKMALAKYRMTLGENLIEIPGRRLPYETIRFGQKAE